MIQNSNLNDTITINLCSKLSQNCLCLKMPTGILLAAEAAAAASSVKENMDSLLENGKKIKTYKMQKKNPQKKMKHFFKVTKPKTKKKNLEKNVQGFLISDCRYDDFLGIHVFCPSTYDGDPDADICGSCLLRPCIASVGSPKRVEILSYCEEVRQNDAEKTNFLDKEFLHMKVMSHVESLFAEMYGARYVRNHCTPVCLVNLIEAHWKQFELVESDSDPDEDLILGSES